MTQLAKMIDDLRQLQRIVEKESGTKLDIIATVDPSLYVDIARHYPDDARAHAMRTPNGIAKMELGERCQLTVVARPPASMVDDASRPPAFDTSDDVCICGRARGSAVHSPTERANNGHAFEPMPADRFGDDLLEQMISRMREWWEVAKGRARIEGEHASLKLELHGSGEGYDKEGRELYSVAVTEEFFTDHLSGTRDPR
jgi:hypothetical protein